MKELIKKLTEHYAWCIQNMPEEGFYNFCVENYVQHGICECIEFKFNSYISKSIINEFTHGRLFLCDPPSNINLFYIEPSYIFERTLESLRTRHKRLLEMADYKE